MRILLCLILSVALPAAAQIPEAPETQQPDERLKADILAIVAHADDDTLLIGYLARAVYDEQKRVAVVFITRGDHGANRAGVEQAASLGWVREMEARRAFASLGVLDVFFLDAPNISGDNPLWSLEKWPHGKTLEEVVRLIRLTRPEVVLTWLPDYVAGQNHCDHQAAGVLATEAFDLAGSPVAFPSQVTPPEDPRGYGNLTEGLEAWQPKKLYYVSDTAHTDFLEGAGPKYLTTDISPSRKVPYSAIVARQNSFYLTQSEGLPALRALASGNYENYEAPVHLVLGRSLVKSSVTGDVFEGIAPGPVPFAPVRGHQPESREGVSVELGSPWDFYRRFWSAHNLEHLAKLHAPESRLVAGATARVPLLLRNDTGQARNVTLTVKLPDGWKEVRGTARYPVRPHAAYPVRTELVGPSVSSIQWQEVTWTAQVDGAPVSSATLRFLVAPTGAAFRAAGTPKPE
ncbi:MAG: PIG-L family deacetylase [Bryobacteraceae bacterium]|nr:PIG-L family deacetylase [Bryobacteraceae bacterium]